MGFFTNKPRGTETRRQCPGCGGTGKVQEQKHSPGSSRGWDWVSRTCPTCSGRQWATR